MKYLLPFSSDDLYFDELYSDEQYAELYHFESIRFHVYMCKIEKSFTFLYIHILWIYNVK